MSTFTFSSAKVSISPDSPDFPYALKPPTKKSKKGARLVHMEKLRSSRTVCGLALSNLPVSFLLESVECANCKKLALSALTPLITVLSTSEPEKVADILTAALVERSVGFKLSVYTKNTSKSDRRRARKLIARQSKETIQKLMDTL